MAFTVPGLFGGVDPESMPFPSQGLILDMISDNLLSYPKIRGFLIDGFPRELEQAKEFERIVSDLIP
jgi:adenylate kinase family enzyme